MNRFLKLFVFPNIIVPLIGFVLAWIFLGVSWTDDGNEHKYYFVQYETKIHILLVLYIIFYLIFIRMNWKGRKLNQPLLWSSVIFAIAYILIFYGIFILGW